MDWYNLDLIAFRCTTGTTTGTKSSLDLPTDGSVGKIVFTPVQAPDRAFYRLEWLGYIGGLLTEELAGSLPVVGASPAIPATSSVVAPTGFEPVFGRGHVFANCIVDFLFLGSREKPRD